MGTQRRPVTWGPKGKPGASCPAGSPCFRHPNVDWTVHRLTPALYERGKVGGMRRKVIGKIARAGVPEEAEKNAIQRRPGTQLKQTSPRWGEGTAPGLRSRKTVPLPKKGTVEVSKKTYAVGGAAVAGYAGYKAYQHRDQIKEKAHNMHQQVHTAFHSTRGMLGAHGK